MIFLDTSPSWYGTNTAWLGAYDVNGHQAATFCQTYLHTTLSTKSEVQNAVNEG